jgi:hypothetical protein
MLSRRISWSPQRGRSAMTSVFRALRRCWAACVGRRAGGAGVGDPLRPTVILARGIGSSSAVLRVSLDGSMLGEVVAPYLRRDGFAFVAPTLGVGFIEPWRVYHEDGPGVISDG